MRGIGECGVFNMECVESFEPRKIKQGASFGI